MEPNLMITHDPTHAARAKQEIEDLLKKETEYKFHESGFEGVYLVRVADNPKKVVHILSFICKNQPYRFKYTYRWIPIESWCNADLKELSEFLKRIDSDMDPNKSWMMEINKRGYEGDTVSLITSLTESITKPKVDLKNPDTIIRIEIVGDRAGVSLLHREDMLIVSEQKN